MFDFKALGALVAFVLLAACSQPQHERARPAATAAPAGAPLIEGTNVGDNWVKAGVTRRQYRQDIDNCYSYAKAVQRHDRAIETDIDLSQGDSSQGSSSDSFARDLRRHGGEQRVSSRFRSCMQSKGYVEEQ